MHIVPKPEGYELRDKRSDKQNNAEQWGVRDALYAASQEITDECDGVTVVWRKRHEDGKYSYHRRNAGAKGSTLDLTVTALGLEMSWMK